MAIEMELVGVRIQVPTNAPIMLLKERAEPHRVVPIYIGGPEAHAIDLALSEVETERPMTHDLFVEVIDRLGATPEQVIITELRERTFFADLYLRDATGEVVVISARPSDAVALAARTGMPIFAEDDLVDEAGIVEEEEGNEEEEMVEELRKFLDQVSPEDFGGES